MRFRGLVVFALLIVLPALARAQSSDVTTIEATVAPDLPVQTFSGPLPGPIDVSTCLPSYANQAALQLFYQQNGFEIMDDMHTTARGPQALCAFQVGFYNLSFAQTTMTVTFYENDANDDPPGQILAGPFRIEGLPSGQVVSTFYPLSGVITPNIWMGVRFGAFKGTGLTMAPLAQLGTSHDIAYSPRFGFVNFGGTDVNHVNANFQLAVTSIAPVPTQSETWGSVKAFYR
jgi:hypothetical protein